MSIPLIQGDTCPKCGGQVTEVWGPADQTLQTWEGPQIVHNVIHTLRCDSCLWHRVEDVVNTDQQLSGLLAALRGPR